ncbi:MAG: hypothetical protein LR011_13745, partial [Verrucomicrobia bacterium]|nr:hypothetical protein [Verrucomicrobiota bacterium]
MQTAFDYLDYFNLPDFNPAMKEVLILVGALVIVGLLLLSFVRKAHDAPRVESRGSSSGSSRSRSRSIQKELVGVEDKGDGTMRRKFRRRRKSHRPR